MALIRLLFSVLSVIINYMDGSYIMNYNKELFSIIIPCYNSEEYLPRLLECLKKQSYKKLEIILIDDGSTDSTLKIMEKFKKEVKFNVIIKSQKNKGLGGAINTGLKLVTGEFFSYINSDDLIVDDYVEKFVNYFKNDESVHVIQRNGYIVPENEINLIGKKEFAMINDWNTNPFDEDLFINMLLETNYNFTYVAIRTESFDKVVSKRTIYESRDGQNYQILLPMFKKYKPGYINEPGIFFVERKDSLSRNYKNEKPGKLYLMYDEYKKIILSTLKKMKIDNYNYYEKLIEQKYIVKKLEYARSIGLKNDIDYFEDQYGKYVINDNIYEYELNKVRGKYPLVSIIIPVYNGSNYMKEAIDSALDQDYPNIEIIVVNDGSTDGGKTEKIAKSYGDKITYYKKENGGVSTALNYGISKMKGQFFSWLSHDDRYYSNKISTQMYYLIDNNLLNKKVITYSNYDVINENSEVINETHFEVYNPNANPELSMLRGLVSGTALLIPKSAFEDYGTFDTKYRCVQDYLLFFDFMKTYKYIHIPKITNSTRVHSAQVTNNNKKIIDENDFLWIKMQKETSDDVKIRIYYSLYDFYMKMEEYLGKIASEYSHNNYVGARKYSLEQADKCVEDGKQLLIKLLKKQSSENVYNCLLKIYNDYIDFSSFKESEEYNDDLLSDLKTIVSTMGLFNTIDYLYKNVDDYSIKFSYYKMSKVLSCMYDYCELNSLTWKERLIYSYKVDGKKVTIKKLIKKVYYKLNYNRYTRFIKRIIRLVLKVIFFIPKMIIKFILYI